MGQKLIHIVGGGDYQVHLIKQAKKSGCRTLVTDMFENPPGKKYSDYYERVNTRDIENTLKISNQYKIDAITTDGTDVAVLTVAYIAQQLGLPGIDYKTARNFTDKYRMRETLKNKQIGMPQYRYFSDMEDCCAYINNAEFKYIIKPINSQGSKGVFILTHLDRDKVKKSINESKGNGVLVEEYIEGPQFSVEAVVLNGEVSNLAISEIDFFKNSSIGRRIKYFNAINDLTVDNLFAANKKIVEALNLQNGMTHGEYRINKDSDIFLIEIACRGGGAGISSMAVPYLTNLNTAQVLIDMAFNKPVTVKFEDYRNRKMLIEFFSFVPGKINHMKIDDSIYKFVDFHKIQTKNFEIKPVVDSRDRYGQFVLTGDTKEEIEQKVAEVYNCIDISYE